jgi:hypothetical protein
MRFPPVKLYFSYKVTIGKAFRTVKKKDPVTVHGFKGSGVQGSILVHGVHLSYVFMRKASASSGLIQNLEPNWQLFGKMSIFNEDFGSSITSLSLTLNVEP